MSRDSAQDAAGMPNIITEVDRLIAEARARAASDLHIDPTGTGVMVRMRIDGVLDETEALPAEMAKPIVQRLKYLADLLTYRSDIPQEGRMRAEAAGDLDMRVSTFPTIHGERVVVRFFDRTRAGFRLEDLSLPSEVLSDLQNAARGTSGVVLLTGPAGSGKTTTLYACLNDIVKSGPVKRHILTVEDPVEAPLAGVTQSQVNPAAGLSFAVALRSLLRQDPEVVMVGEIRDRETMDIVAQAGLTGHLVFSTIHAGDAATVFSRLLEMGLEPHVITSAVKVVLGMRLVRKLCPECRSDAPAATITVRGRKTSVAVFDAVGCDACGGAGYRGRLPVVEVAEMDAAVRKAVLARADREAIAAALREGGMVTMRDRAVEMLKEGLTSAQEVQRVLGPVEIVFAD